MDAQLSTQTPAKTRVFTGAIALAIAMGLGRFAFTPLMPLMLRDGTLDAATGTEWAAANYLGYLLGALTASWFARNPLQGLRLGLMGVVLTTVGIAWVDASVAWTGAVLRGGAGVCSAWVLVCASSWCLPALARAGSAALGGWLLCACWVQRRECKPLIIENQSADSAAFRSACCTSKESRQNSGAQRIPSQRT